MLGGLTLGGGTSRRHAVSHGSDTSALHIALRWGSRFTLTSELWWDRGWMDGGKTDVGAAEFVRGGRGVRVDFADVYGSGSRGGERHVW